MKAKDLNTRLRNIGFKKDNASKVWRNSAGVTVSFPTFDTVKVEFGVSATLWRQTDITIKDGYVNVKKPKAECLKFNRCGGGKCDMCLAYEFPKPKRKSVKEGKDAERV